MENKILIKTIILLSTFAITVAISALAFAFGYYVLGGLFVLASFVLAVKNINQYLIYTKKLIFLIAAIDNKDYMFEFKENPNTSKQGLNEYLNKIKTMLVNARKEVEEREKYYELILDKMSGGVIVCNEKNSVLQVNSAVYKILGIEKIIHISNLSYYYEGLTQVFEEIQANSPQTFTLTNEREEVKISIQLNLLKHFGKIHKIYTINNIANELDYKELESWNRLTRVLTHEIMNSLTPIITMSNALKESNKIKDKDVCEGLELIATTSNYLVDFVENYRSLSRIATPVKMPIYVMDLVDSTIKFYENNSNIEFRKDISQTDLMIYADQSQINQIFINLFKNAIEAIGNTKGWIEVKAYCDKDENVIIRIADSGNKLPNEVAEQIFVPFFTTKNGGSGIGLSISRQIMRLHNGNINFYQNENIKYFSLIFR